MKRIQDEKWLNALPEDAVAVAEEINIGIARIIAERIKAIGELTPSDIKKLTNAVEFLGADFKKITKFIEKQSEQGQKAVTEALKQAAEGSDEFAELFYAAKGLSPRTYQSDVYLHKLVNAIANQTGAQFTNLSQTLAYKINGQTLPLRQMYTRAIDKAIYEVQSGTLDYHTAMRKTVRELSANMRYVHWESGHTRRLDSHIRQNVIDGVKQLQTEMLDYHGDQFKSDGVELSAHAICAPDHLAVQGRQFSNEEFDLMQSGLDFKDVKGNEYPGFPRPIGQWNCRHLRFPIIIGVSQPAHTEEQLQEYAQNSREKYDLTQKQRAMETKLRQLKMERLAASAAGDELEAKRIQRKINEQQKAYRGFSAENNLLYDTRRASVEGYRRISIKTLEKSYPDVVGSPNVELSYIESAEYKNKFLGISDNPDVCKAIYERCKAALTHQNGKYREDLSIIDERGALVGSTSSKLDNETKYTDKLNKSIFSRAPFSLIAIHNHGTNVPPTGADLTSAGYHRYAYGIVCCHDGTVYKYSTKGAKPFTCFLFDNTVDKYRKDGYNKKDAMIKTLQDFQRDYGIEWSELK